MAREAQSETSPFRKAMRTTAFACMATAAGILAVHFAGMVEGIDRFIPIALVLGVWANLLSFGLLFSRNRD